MRKLKLLAAMVMMVTTGCGRDDRPTAPLWGSCCVQGSFCEMTTQADCNGAWIQGGSCSAGACYSPQSSPEAVLQNLARAYEERNLFQYEKLLTEDFVFVFPPFGPVDPAHPMPTSWRLAEEKTSTRNMFEADLVWLIRLDLAQQGALQPADSVAYGRRAWRIRVDEAFLRVDTRNEQSEALTYLVPGTTEVFCFREDPTRLAPDGKPTWYIFRWEDMPIGVARTEDDPTGTMIKSWGEIKAMFR